MGDEHSKRFAPALKRIEDDMIADSGEVSLEALNRALDKYDAVERERDMIPDPYHVRVDATGWYLCDSKDKSIDDCSIMGPFDTRKEVVDAFHDNESREA